MPLFIPALECPHCGYDDVPDTERSGDHLKATCKQCGRYIKFLPQAVGDFKLWFGRFKNQRLRDVAASDEGRKYLQWYAALETANQKAQAKIREFLTASQRAER
jgi:hypothetical protein